MTQHWRDGAGIVHRASDVRENEFLDVVADIGCFTGGNYIRGPVHTVTDPVTCLGCLAAKEPNDN